MRLVEGCFGDQNVLQQDRLFGFYTGQARSEPIIRYGLWFNGLGVRLTHGDLDAADFKWLAENLRPDELFVVMYPGKVTELARQEFSGLALPEVERKMKAPGVEFIAKHATYCFSQNKMFFLGEDSSAATNQRTVDVHGLPLTVLTRTYALDMFRIAELATAR